MRLKTIPEDFRVRELLEFREVEGGEYYVHLLHKEKLSTQEALSMLVREADLERDRIAYAGLKDRQAVTDQYVSIQGRAVEVKLPGLRVTPVGRTDEPVKSRQSRGNAFTIVIRDLSPFEAATLRRNLPSLQKTGFPNYFDDQRFGSLRHGQGFPMVNVLRGEFERALVQMVATPSPRAITGDVKLKQVLQRHWGDFEACLRIARGPIYEPLFRHLIANPGDFRGALEFLPVRQRVIHAFAYQSLLWNRALSRMLRGGVPSAQRLRIATLAGDFLAWKYLEPEREEKLAAMDTPLYGPEGQGGSEPFRRAMAQELEEIGVRKEDFAENQVPGMIWKEEPRQAIVKPKDLTDVRIAPDDRHEGRVQATLSFALPRGAYATMMLKRLFAPPFYSREAPGERGGDRPGRREHGEREVGRDGAGRGGHGGRGGHAGFRRSDGVRSTRPSQRGPRPHEGRRSAPWETEDDEELDA